MLLRINDVDDVDVVPGASVENWDGRLTGGPVIVIVEWLASAPSYLFLAEVVGELC